MFLQLKQEKEKKILNNLIHVILVIIFFSWYLTYRLPALNRSTSESPESTFTHSTNVKSKAIIRSNTEIIQSKSKNTSNKSHNKFKTGGIVATAACLKPVKKLKKLSDFAKVDCIVNKPSLGPTDSPICGKITLKKIKTKFKKKKTDKDVLSSQQSIQSTTD